MRIKTKKKICRINQIAKRKKNDFPVKVDIFGSTARYIKHIGFINMALNVGRTK